MALSVKVGLWTGNGTGSQAVTGVGFLPKALIAWRVNTNNDDSFAINARYSIGFATRRGGTTQQRSVSYQYNDNLSTSTAFRQWSTALVYSISDIKVTLSSFDADGFTVAYGASSSDEYGYIAIGGADLTDAIVVEDDWPTTGATFDVIGAGFTPDAAIYLTGVGTGTAEDSTAEAGAAIGFGVFAGSAQWSLSTSATSGDTMTSAMNNNSVFSADACITLMGYNADTVDAKGIFSAFTSDGATITNTNAPAAALRIFALYLQGGQYKAGSQAKAATASADSFTFNTPTFTPTGVLLGQAVGTTSNTVVTATAEMTVGGASATDGTAEGYAGFTAGETINTTADMIKSQTKAIAELTPGTTPAVDAAGDMTAFASGSFTLTWDATGTAALVGFLAMGDAAVVTDQEPALIGGKLVRNSLLLRHMVH